MKIKKTIVKHIHKYILRDIGRTIPYKVLACNLCSHYLPQLELALDRESICNYCDNIFKINRRSLKLAKPHCGCRYRKDVVTDNDIDDVMERFGIK